MNFCAPGDADARASAALCGQTLPGGAIPDPLTILAMKKKRQLLRETGEARAASAADGDFVPLDSSKVGPNNSEHSRRDPMSDPRSAVSQAPGKAPGRESGVVREEDEVGEGDEFFEEYAGSKIAFGTQPGRDAA